MIDTQAIRNKILDLALRGKLTEQLPEDGTAEEMYQRIQAEKEMLNKPVKAKKEKPLQENEENILPHEIPDNWKWVQFGELFSLTNGTASRGTVGGSAYPVLRLADLKNGEIDTRSIRKVLLSESEYKSHILKKGDMIFIRVNGSREKVAMPFCYHCEESISYCDHLFCAHCVSSLIFVPYVRLAFMISSTREQIEPKIKTTAGQNTINQEGLGSIFIPIPPVSEQYRIVETIQKAFSDLDTIDVLQAQYHDNLTILKSKLIDAGIQGKLTEQLPEDGTAEELYQQIQQEKQALEKAGKIKKSKPLPPVSDEEKPFDIPENWKWVRIASLGTTTTGGTPSKDHPEYYGGNYPFFKPSDLDRGHHITKASEYLTEFGKEASRQLPKGSLLVCCIGSIGKCAIIDIDGTANQQINALAPIMCDSDYLLYAIDNDAFKYQLNQGSRATTVSIINKNKFDNCIIPLPPLAEQKRIVDKLEELLPLCKG